MPPSRVARPANATRPPPDRQKVWPHCSEVLMPMPTQGGKGAQELQISASVLRGARKLLPTLSLQVAREASTDVRCDLHRQIVARAMARCAGVVPGDHMLELPIPRHDLAHLAPRPIRVEDERVGPNRRITVGHGIDVLVGGALGQHHFLAVHVNLHGLLQLCREALNCGLQPHQLPEIVGWILAEHAYVRGITEEVLDTLPRHVCRAKHTCEQTGVCKVGQGHL
mmetsp:Transcript_84223/g.212368  ORF Transcript_84223/g.212368 Transcript_84223/m.212368 type:complete len:225 (+) Transcript_84223:302-976(+)